MLKQYVFVPKSLKMSPGKMASQVAHATLLALDKDVFTQTYKSWKQQGMCVIVLQCKDLQHLEYTREYMRNWKIHHHLYIDEGNTETQAMMPTALATGILTEEQQQLFQNFKMYK